MLLGVLALALILLLKKIIKPSRRNYAVAEKTGVKTDD